jgi:hypothetical protein
MKLSPRLILRQGIVDNPTHLINQAIHFNAVRAGKELDRFRRAVRPAATTKAVAIKDRPCLRVRPEQIGQHGAGM